MCKTATLDADGGLKLVEPDDDSLVIRVSWWVTPAGHRIMLTPVKRYIGRGLLRRPNPVGRALFVAGYRPA